MHRRSPSPNDDEGSSNSQSIPIRRNSRIIPENASFTIPLSESSPKFNSFLSQHKSPVQQKELVKRIIQEHLVAEDDDQSPIVGSLHLGLIGGDTLHDIYKWSENQESSAIRRRNSASDLQSLKMAPEIATSADPSHLRASDLRQPGMFRRSFLVQRADGKPLPNNITRNFIVLYGYYGGDIIPEEGEDGEPTDNEAMPLIRPMHSTPIEGISAKKALFMLLKAFVGTGVLFLPKAFANGGMGFSIVLLLFIGTVTLHCMLLLVETSRVYGGMSFGDLGAHLYGPRMRQLVLLSISVAQCGFCCAYFIFISANLRDLTMLFSDCKIILPQWLFIIFQVMIYFPLSWVRRIKYFSITSLIADVFILLGLSYIFLYDVSALFTVGPAKNWVWINYESFPIFVGTALFAFEGICLILPIAETMKRPDKFGHTLTVCCVIIGILFIVIGALGYATFGENVSTIVFLDLPDSPMVPVVQFSYAIAIMLSFPLTAYPAIRITETAIFGASTGKSSLTVKWQKNIYRAIFVAFLGSVAHFGAENLDKFVSLVGIFACIPLMFIYPCLFHTFVATSPMVKLKDYTLASMGFVALVYNTYYSVAQMINGGKDIPIDRCATRQPT